MSSIFHSYGPTCRLARANPSFDATSSSAPGIQTQYFYVSALPIDDPLSALPPTSSTSPSDTNNPLLPFSAYDNAALEEAWQGLENTPVLQYKKPKPVDAIAPLPLKVELITQPANPASTAAPGDHDMEPQVISQPEPLPQQNKTERETLETANVQNQPSPFIEEENDSKIKTASPIRGRNRRESNEKDKKSFRTSMKVALRRTRSGTRLSSKPSKRSTSDATCSKIDIQALEISETPSEKKIDHVKKPSASKEKALTKPIEMFASKDTVASRAKALESQYGSSPIEKITTGTPFVRAPDREITGLSAHKDTAESADATEGTDIEERSGRSISRGTSRSRSESRHRSSSGSQSRSRSRSRSHSRPQSLMEAIESSDRAYVPVGISRLHVVKIPQLQMKPIYWSPVHDISTVIRGTWFYKATMLPIEAALANQLEAGYTELKPWSETWNDELNSAIEAGAEGEMKIIHRLWPKTQSKGDPRDNRSSSPGVAQTSENISAEGPPIFDTTTDPAAKLNKRYPKSSIIYLDARQAFILKPSLLPDGYYAKKPLAQIRKGKTVGIPVVRGFDWLEWERINPSTKPAYESKTYQGAIASQSGVAASDLRKLCTACAAREERPKVTDLVLVIHGIGQKLSERVESFNFTHAINAFRRDMHVEMCNTNVKSHLRDGVGIMTLPVNWRSNLSFDDGVTSAGEYDSLADSNINEFGLTDITPNTIPAVRNIISDVMLDIPYYLSHHKSKMVQAVVKEANRVYRLWCLNNPDFPKSGRVHIIGHSLGSTICLDILSKQPTELPKDLDLRSRRIRTDIFEFNTSNLFFCGSPAGFFLLLNRAQLLPRKGREKPGADGEDLGKGVAGEAETYGCLAVDNIYNILYSTDPIAYKLNATVDLAYAASLKHALIPSSNLSFFESISSVFKFAPVERAKSTASSIPIAKPNVPRLPSTIEMETHNFTREELAEKRMFLLNDNGQIDWFLSTGGGPLDLQYLNMLGAHSGYWTSQDFIRFIVTEIGRDFGKDHTLPNIRAVKRPFGKKGLN
ncbi:MAG: hypothetical protein M1829_006872 [Trizodia sp. TS-e1964]|nr:MAG: hypothetical protein M1829_006872 [Trizodia sp. TS-e1964]